MDIEDDCDSYLTNIDYNHDYPLEGVSTLLASESNSSSSNTGSPILENTQNQQSLCSYQSLDTLK